MVYAMTVDLPWSDELRFVFARHRNRRHYDDGDLIYFLVNHYRATPRGRPAVKGQSCLFSEETSPKEIKIQEIVKLFHSCRTTVKHGIYLANSDAQDLVDEVLNNKRTINGAYNAVKNANKADAVFKGLRLRNPIPITEEEAEAYAERLAASGLSVEESLAILIRQHLANHQVGDIHKESDINEMSSEITALIPDADPPAAISPAASLEAVTAPSTAHTDVPPAVEAIAPASEPTTTEVDTDAASNSVENQSPMNVEVVREQSPGKRSKHGLKRWELKTKIAVLEMKRDGICDDFIAITIGPNSEGNLVSSKALEHLVSHYGLSNKQFPNKEDRDKYNEVINRLKAELEATTAS